MRLPTTTLAAIGLTLVMIGGCASRPQAADAAGSAAAAATATAAPVASGNPKTTLPHRSGSFRFEAERAAENAGCFGPNRERPAADRRSQSGGIEFYDVQCADRVVSVQCDLGMCRATR